MNEELILAIEELRQRPTDRAWFLPVLISACEVPDRAIGAGETLQDIQQVRLYEDWAAGLERIVSVIQPDLLGPVVDEKLKAAGAEIITSLINDLDAEHPWDSIAKLASFGAAAVP